jgi:uncharacterized protein (UPF0261 family)
VDIPGNSTYDPKENRIFREELRRRLKLEIEIIEVNASLEDPEFAESMVKSRPEVL